MFKRLRYEIVKVFFIVFRILLYYWNFFIPWRAWSPIDWLNTKNRKWHIKMEKLKSVKNHNCTAINFCVNKFVLFLPFKTYNGLFLFIYMYSVQMLWLKGWLPRSSYLLHTATKSYKLSFIIITIFQLLEYKYVVIVIEVTSCLWCNFIHK